MVKLPKLDRLYNYIDPYLPDFGSDCQIYEHRVLG